MSKGQGKGGFKQPIKKGEETHTKGEKTQVKSEGFQTKKINEEELGKEFMVPDYRPKSLLRKKQISKTKKRKLNKIARKSRKVNQRWAKNK